MFCLIFQKVLWYSDNITTLDYLNGIYKNALVHIQNTVVPFCNCGMVFGLVLSQIPWYYSIASLWYYTIQFCKGHIFSYVFFFLTNATLH